MTIFTRNTLIKAIEAALEEIPVSRGEETMIYTLKDIDIMARTVYGESRGEPYEGQIAVAWVILNRALRNTWFGKGISEVCFKHLQFSCWNPGDPNFPLITSAIETNPAFLQCKGIASLVIVHRLPDLSHGATHYHAQQIKPSWAGSLIPTTAIGNHIFYKEK